MPTAVMATDNATDAPINDMSSSAFLCAREQRWADFGYLQVHAHPQRPKTLLRAGTLCTGSAPADITMNTTSLRAEIGSDLRRNLVIVPAHNEVEAISGTVAEIHASAPDFDVVVIDDGSSDETSARAAEAGAAVLRLPFNLGIGGAMQSGYLYALENGYEVAVQVDGDGQHDPRNIHDLLAHLRANPALDMVTGSRFLVRESEGFRSTGARRVGIRILGGVISLITHQRVTDPTSGLRMTNRRGIALFAREYPHDYPEVEAILLLHAHHLRRAEIPVIMRPRLTGTSAISSTQSVYYMVKVLLALFVGIFRARPERQE